ncbi:DUF5906 domain-containing protein [Oerskovia sp. NPDC060338]|uniref:DUF5906 domain-containing protein n=1 Tax=Oerskovia sp. NPDC060338 TaxID=3347100 RepID=UPI00365FA142
MSIDLSPEGIAAAQESVKDWTEEDFEEIKQKTAGPIDVHAGSRAIEINTEANVKYVKEAFARIAQTRNGLGPVDTVYGEVIRHIAGGRIINFDDEWYVWNGTMFEKTPDRAVEIVLLDAFQNWLFDYSYTVMRDEYTDDGIPLGKGPVKINPYTAHAQALNSDRTRNAVLKQLRMRCTVTQDFWAAGDRFLAFADGTVIDRDDVLRNKRLVPLHADPSMAIRHTLQANWEPDAKAPVYSKFTTGSIPDTEQREWLEAMAGIALLGLPDHKAVPLLLGPPNAGKSRYAFLWREIAGGYGDEAQQNSLLREKTFNREEYLSGARCLVLDEPSLTGQVDGQFVKMFTSGVPFKVERKGRDPLGGRFIGKLFITSNDDLRLGTMESGLSDRLVVVDFPHGHKAGSADYDPDLGEKLSAEANGVVQVWLKAALESLTTPVKVPVSNLERLAERDSEDSVGAWWSESIERGIIRYDPERYWVSRRAFEDYNRYCEVSGFDKEKMTVIGFGKRLRKILGLKEFPNMTINGKSERIIPEWTYTK